MKRPAVLYLLIAIQAFFTAMAVPTGIILILDPSGSSMGMNFMLPSIPYISSFLPVGLWLLIAFGIFPAVLAVGLFESWRWTRIATIVLGAVELLWISVQIVLLYSFGLIFWQFLIPALAAVSIGLCFLPSVRVFFGESAARRTAYSVSK